jgi:hypothetical protein
LYLVSLPYRSATARRWPERTWHFAALTQAELLRLAGGYGHSRPWPPRRASRVSAGREPWDRPHPRPAGVSRKSHNNRRLSGGRAGLGASLPATDPHVDLRLRLPRLDSPLPPLEERATGIEPALKAWKAFVQPQHFARRSAKLRASATVEGLAATGSHTCTPIQWPHRRGVAQLVVHRSPKPGVAGSSPVSPASGRPYFAAISVTPPIGRPEPGGQAFGLRRRRELAWRHAVAAPDARAGTSRSAFSG